MSHLTRSSWLNKQSLCDSDGLSGHNFARRICCVVVAWAEFWTDQVLTSYFSRQNNTKFKQIWIISPCSFLLNWSLYRCEKEMTLYVQINWLNLVLHSHRLRVTNEYQEDQPTLFISLKASLNVAHILVNYIKITSYQFRWKIVSW